jgi:hypothetical protein
MRQKVKRRKFRIIPRPRRGFSTATPRGEFKKTVFSTGIDFHEARVADLNGDGRPDILDKPYNWETPRVDVWLQLPPD